MNQEPISLETPVGSEEDSELGDFVEDQKQQVLMKLQIERF